MFNGSHYWFPSKHWGWLLAIESSHNIFWKIVLLCKKKSLSFHCSKQNLFHLYIYIYIYILELIVSLGCNQSWNWIITGLGRNHSLEETSDVLFTYVYHSILNRRSYVKKLYLQAILLKIVIYLAKMFWGWK